MQQLTCPRCTAWQPLSLLGSLGLGPRAATAQECNISNLSYLLESFELAFASALHESGSRSCGSQRIDMTQCLCLESIAQPAQLAARADQGERLA